jgi:hypothetical protein
LQYLQYRAFDIIINHVIILLSKNYLLRCIYFTYTWQSQRRKFYILRRVHITRARVTRYARE